MVCSPHLQGQANHPVLQRWCLGTLTQYHVPALGSNGNSLSLEGLCMSVQGPSEWHPSADCPSSHSCWKQVKMGHFLGLISVPVLIASIQDPLQLQGTCPAQSKGLAWGLLALSTAVTEKLENIDQHLPVNQFPPKANGLLPTGNRVSPIANQGGKGRPAHTWDRC